MWIYCSYCFVLVNSMKSYPLAKVYLGYILVVGDLNYKSLDTLELLSVDELPRVVQANRHNFTTEVLTLENREISADSNQVPFFRVI